MDYNLAISIGRSFSRSAYWSSYRREWINTQYPGATVESVERWFFDNSIALLPDAGLELFKVGSSFDRIHLLVGDHGAIRRALLRANSSLGTVLLAAHEGQFGRTDKNAGELPDGNTRLLLQLRKDPETQKSIDSVVLHLAAILRMHVHIAREHADSGAIKAVIAVTPSLTNLDPTMWSQALACAGIEASVVLDRVKAVDWLGPDSKGNVRAFVDCDGSRASLRLLAKDTEGRFDFLKLAVSKETEIATFEASTTSSIDMKIASDSRNSFKSHMLEGNRLVDLPTLVQRSTYQVHGPGDEFANPRVTLDGKSDTTKALNIYGWNTVVLMGDVPPWACKFTEAWHEKLSKISQQEPISEAVQAAAACAARNRCADPLEGAKRVALEGAKRVEDLISQDRSVQKLSAASTDDLIPVLASLANGGVLFSPARKWVL